MPASNPGQAGSLGAHAETNRAVWSARARGSQALVPWLTSKIYETVEQSVWALSKGPQGPQTRPTRWTTILRWRWVLRLRYQV